MPETIKTYVKTISRHIRVLILINEAIPEEKLRVIMELSQHYWGGRYNPIIPIIENKIPEEWLKMVKHYDPDFIYYPRTFDIDYLKSLQFLQPAEYIDYNEETNSFNLQGINIHELLHDQVEGNAGIEKLSILLDEGKWDMPLAAKPFYKLNLGFKQSYLGEKKWLKRYTSIDINELNSSKINQLIYEEKPFFKSILSSLHISSAVLNSGNSHKINKFEWIIYNPEDYLQDLLYYWNRQQYVEPKNLIKQVISTEKELLVLLVDTYFPALIYRLCFSHSISLVSTTIANERLIEFRKIIQEKNFNINIETENIKQFPFEYNSFDYTASKYLTAQNNLLVGNNDFLKFSPLSFESGNIVQEGSYAIDTVILRDTTGEQNEIKFPFETPLYHLVTKSKARVNRFKRISVFRDCKQQGTEFKIPSDADIFSHLLRMRENQHKPITLPIKSLFLSNSGQKMSAFFNLFEGNWGYIKEFLEERFWVNLFRYHTEVNESAIPSGKGIFSFKDIENEINELFNKYENDITSQLIEATEGSLNLKDIEGIIKRNKKETFQNFINPNLNYLIKQGGLFMGMKVPCQRCGSNKWYSLNQLSDKLNCKGCNNTITPDLSSKVYYKLSEILINNLLNDQTKNGKKYDGNYIVFKTLLYLKNDSDDRGNSFIWSPPLQFITDSQNGSWSSDLDIIAIQNGKLIIGEAKASADLFYRKDINQLIWVANNLSPDKIILACENGNLDDKVAKVKAGIINPNCEVITYKTYKPWYHFHGIFGFPHDEHGENRTI